MFEIHRKLGILKWHKGFKCLKCNNRRAYKLIDYSKKCSKCKRKESVTSNTAFHGLRIDLNTAMEILISIQDRWDECYFEGASSSRYGEQPRLSIKDLSEQTNIEQKQIWRFLNAVITWLPKSFFKKSEADISWFRGVNKINYPRYHALYRLLFDGNSKRDEDEVLYILVFKKIPKDIYEIDL